MNDTCKGRLEYIYTEGWDYRVHTYGRLGIQSRQGENWSGAILCVFAENVNILTFFSSMELAVTEISWLLIYYNYSNN